jgi:hypothetical protein
MHPSTGVALDLDHRNIPLPAEKSQISAPR